MNWTSNLPLTWQGWAGLALVLVVCIGLYVTHPKT